MSMAEYATKRRLLEPEVGDEERPTSNLAVRGIRWALDRMVAVAYGVVYDYIVERFEPYRKLHREVRQAVEDALPPGANPREVRVLDVACGPGNLTLALAQAGFDVVGIDAYGGLVDLAREKRNVGPLANLAFRRAELAEGGIFPDESFHQLVNVHSLYVHPDPAALLKAAFQVLAPGGQAVFVNFTRRVRLAAIFRAVRRGEGVGAALRSLLWVLPNSIFEVAHKRVGPHYWQEDEFADRLREAGFTVVAVRRTFLDGASLLVLARKRATDVGA